MGLPGITRFAIFPSAFPGMTRAGTAESVRARV